MPRKSPMLALRSPRSPLLKRGVGGDFAERYTFHAHGCAPGAWGIASASPRNDTGACVPNNNNSVRRGGLRCNYMRYRNERSALFLTGKPVLQRFIRPPTSSENGLIRHCDECVSPRSLDLSNTTHLRFGNTILSYHAQASLRSPLFLVVCAALGGVQDLITDTPLGVLTFSGRPSTMPRPGHPRLRFERPVLSVSKEAE